MNVKEYISSGIIESYVLGMATESERKDFEIMCAAYPEIAAARTAFEVTLEEQLLSDAKQPPARLKQEIEQKLASGTAVTAPAEITKEETPVRRINGWKWLAAASILLLAGTLYWGLTTNNKYNRLQQANRDTQQQLEQTSAQLATLKEDAEMLHKPDVKMAALHSATDPAMYATIYWDTTSKDVYLLVNNMPQPASDKQYQLWALLNGQPIDLGVFARQERLLVKMKNVQNAQAFAITLEPKGGSLKPTSNPLVLTKM